MGETRNRYNKEFKEETVKYIQQHGKPVTAIAEELNIPVKTLYQWVEKFRKFEDEPFVGSGNIRAEEKRVKELEAQVKDLEEEVAILKKAMHVFSKDRK